MLVTYITKYKDHFFNHCVAWFFGCDCEAIKQDSICSKLPFKYFRNRHMSVNQLEKLPCIVCIVDISK